MKISASFVPIVLMLVFSCGRLAADSYVLAGSDLFSGPVEKALAVALAGSGLDIEIKLSGSLLGKEGMKSGEVDACILAIPDSEPVPDSSRVYPLAFQTAVFAVHDENPVRELAYGDLKRLFGAENPLERWSGLIPDSVWAERKVAVQAIRRQDLVILEMLHNEILGGGDFRESLKITDSDPKSAVSEIRLNPNLLVMVPYTEMVPPVRLVDIKKEEGDQSYNPSRANVFYGDYPLRLPFYLVLGESANPALAGELLKAFFSPEVTAALEERNFVPLPDQEMRELLSRFD